MKKWHISLLASTILTVVLAGILYYFYLPAMNVKSLGMWVYLVILLVFFVGANELFLLMGKSGNKNGHRASGIAFLVAVIAVLFVVVLTCASSTVFHAKRYASILTVNEDCDFDKDLAETLSTDAIAIMDTGSARKLRLALCQMW